MNYRLIKHEIELKKRLQNMNSKNGTESPNSLSKENTSMPFKDYYTNLKEELLNKYKNKTLKHVKGSKLAENEYSECLKIVQKEKINFKLKECDFKEELDCNLKLVKQIGPNTEYNLKKKGYGNIASLLNHRRYWNYAQIAIDKIESGSFTEKFNLIKKRDSSNLIKTLNLLDFENLKFMDIETLGFSNVPIILLGIAELKDKNIVSTQYFLQDKKEEPAILHSLLRHLNEDSVFVTYNGASFDVPFIKNRFSYYRMNYNYNIPNYDLIHFTRRLWRNILPNCKLTTIEKYLLNIERINDVPGSHIPNYYETYLEEKNIGPIIPIIEHNRRDIVSLAQFLMKIHDEIVE
ncbi:MAG: ribonuclease H-like domain-containing protein [Methanobrevibacter sp.]|jgi:uncharacterized protein YprB with RNaseH-like and TPR domain|nr:ribonuclease H-like domain-containing protein [Candidatus Methanovirga australis]